MIQKVRVVGAGLMGSEIALVFALAGKDVLLNDTSEEGLKRAKDNLAKILEKGVARGFYLQAQLHSCGQYLDDFHHRAVFVRQGGTPRWFPRHAFLFAGLPHEAGRSHSRAFCRVRCSRAWCRPATTARRRGAVGTNMKRSEQ